MAPRKDQMTSNERMQAYFDGKEVDRLPAMPMIDSVGPRLVGKETRFKGFQQKTRCMCRRRRTSCSNWMAYR